MRRRKLFVALALALVVSAIAVPVFASHATTGTVGATVTPGVFSVSLDNDGVAYGTLNLEDVNKEPVDVDTVLGGDQTQLCSTNTNPSVTATNNGNIVSTFLITGGNSDDWTIQAAVGTDQFVHRFATDGNTCDFTVLSATPQDLGTGGDSADIAINGTVTVFLQLDMPDDVVAGLTVQTLPITITATAGP